MRAALSSRLRRSAIAAAAFVALVSLAAPGWARGGDHLNIVRDTEIENDIRTLGTPIWRAAGLDPADMKIYLVSDDQLNSFVAGGQAIFINTGLIEKAQTPDQLIGVLAHETGHIVGGHVILAKEAMHNAGIESLLAMAAGAAAAALGGNGAPLLAASGVGERSFMRFSVAQEATADHAALNFLDRACLSARGLLQFFQILQSNEMLAGVHEQKWEMTHPLTEERIQYVREHVARARCSNAPDPPGSALLLKTIQAKLHGFLDPPQTTLAAYPATDKSALARYARAIAYYRIPDLAHALPEIGGLIRDFPDNAYYRELKGQMLFENGRVREAIMPYQAAVRLLPSAPLLRISLSQVYIETGAPSLNRLAIANLKDASRQEARDGQLWHFLAVAYGRDGQMGQAALALAEEALAGGKQKEATREATRAEHLLPRSSDGYSRALEIGREAKDLDE